MRPELVALKIYLGSTEIRTRIAGFKVQSANHYTIEPAVGSRAKLRSQIYIRGCGQTFQLHSYQLDCMIFKEFSMQALKRACV